MKECDDVSVALVVSGSLNRFLYNGRRNAFAWSCLLKTYAVMQYFFDHLFVDTCASMGVTAILELTKLEGLIHSVISHSQPQLKDSILFMLCLSALRHPRPKLNSMLLVFVYASVVTVFSLLLLRVGNCQNR